MSEVKCFFSRKGGVKFINIEIPYMIDGKKAMKAFSVNMNVVGYYPFHHDWKKEIESMGGEMPEEVFSSFEKLYKLAMDNNVNFLKLVVQALQGQK